jgi:hypothetical protein
MSLLRVMLLRKSAHGQAPAVVPSPQAAKPRSRAVAVVRSLHPSHHELRPPASAIGGGRLPSMIHRCVRAHGHTHFPRARLVLGSMSRRHTPPSRRRRAAGREAQATSRKPRDGTCRVSDKGKGAAQAIPIAVREMHPFDSPAKGALDQCVQFRRDQTILEAHRLQSDHHRLRRMHQTCRRLLATAS